MGVNLLETGLQAQNAAGLTTAGTGRLAVNAKEESLRKGAFLVFGRLYEKNVEILIQTPVTYLVYLHILPMQ